MRELRGFCNHFDIRLPRSSLQEIAALAYAHSQRLFFLRGFFLSLRLSFLKLSFICRCEEAFSRRGNLHPEPIQSLRVSVSERGNLPPEADITHVFIKYIT